MKAKTLFLGIITMLLLASLAGAEKQDDLLILEEQANSIYFAGDTVTVNNSVFGDIYALAGRIDVNAQIQHDLVAISEKVSVNAPVGGSVRVIASNVKIDSAVFRDLLVVASRAEITNKSMIGENAYITANQAIISGEIRGDLKARAKTLVINSVIHGDAYIEANNLELGPRALIIGNVEAKGVSINESKVIGSITEKEVTRTPMMLPLMLGYLSFAILIILSGFLLVYFAPRYTGKSLVRISRNPFISFLAGLLSTIIIPVIAFLLAITLVGIPIALLLMVAYALFWLTAIIYTAILFGNMLYRLLDGKPNHSISLVVGTILYLIIFSIPLVGKPIILIAVLISLGASLTSPFYRKKARPKAKKKRVGKRIK